MRNVLFKIVFLFALSFSFIEVHAQYKIEGDGWGGDTYGRLVSTGYHVCGSFFDKVPLSLAVQYQSSKKCYHISCLFSLYAPCELPPQVYILLKGKSGEILELTSDYVRSGTQKRETRLDRKPFYRYETLVNFEVTEEKFKEIINAQIVKVRFQTENQPLDKVFKNNDFSNTLYMSYISILRRIYPERFKDELREGF